jgi:hypothetical protein
VDDRDDPRHAAAAIASFRGITGIDNMVFEFDGPRADASLERQLAIADAVLSQGASLKAANYSYGTQLPSTYPLLVELGKRIARANARPAATTPAKEETLLLFVSKWANYCYREPTEWVHDEQFAAWRSLTSRGLPVRFICEDNLDEPDLTGYAGLHVADPAPLELIPRPQREKLAALRRTLKAVP